MGKSRLGKGLEALFGERFDLADRRYIQIELGLLKPNPRQPRKDLDEESLQSLAESMKREGILQPIIVRRDGEGYELIAGGRRVLAAKLAGLEKIPAIVYEANEQRSLILALLENIQRKDLNPIEKASAFKELIDELGVTQEEIAQRIGIARSTLANFLRLLELPPPIKEAVSRGTISAGHARALLSLTDDRQRVTLLGRILKEDLSVRALERIINSFIKGDKKTFPPKDENILDLQERLSHALGTKVLLCPGKKAGRIIIHYYSPTQLEEILRRFGI
jgi:ParB family chromosome partitioning protein